MLDNLQHEHVELPHVLDLAVHLVPLQTWVGRGGHTETLRYLANPNSSGVVAHVIIVSPQVP